MSVKVLWRLSPSHLQVPLANRVTTPGYTVTVKLEIIVFSVKTEQMIWAGATQSVNPKSGKKLVNEAAGLIVKDMKKAELL